MWKLFTVSASAVVAMLNVNMMRAGVVDMYIEDGNCSDSLNAYAAKTWKVDQWKS
jgi:hypothetical protein